jgi:hypothetical protein
MMMMMMTTMTLMIILTHCSPEYFSNSKYMPEARYEICLRHIAEEYDQLTFLANYTNYEKTLFVTLFFN